MKITYALLLIAVFSCDRHLEKDSEFFNKFNDLARESFNKTYTGISNNNTERWERCMLEVVINNYLDEINNWKTEVIDSFYVRKYYWGDRGQNFAFVANKKHQFYFIHLADVYDMKPYEYKDGMFDLRDSSIFAIRTIKSASLKRFLEQEVFVGREPVKSIKEANKLMGEIFPELDIELTSSQLLDQLKSEFPQNFRHISTVIFPVLNNSEGTLAYKIYKTESMGFFLFNYRKNKQQNVILDIHFIPSKQRHSRVMDVDRTKYNVCF